MDIFYVVCFCVFFSGVLTKRKSRGLRTGLTLDQHLARSRRISSPRGQSRQGSPASKSPFHPAGSVCFLSGPSPPKKKKNKDKQNNPGAKSCSSWFPFDEVLKRDIARRPGRGNAPISPSQLAGRGDPPRARRGVPAAAPTLAESGGARGGSGLELRRMFSQNAGLLPGTGLI